MHGIGNDYIYIDCITNPIPDNISQLAQKLSDRHFGIGADGIVLILPSNNANCTMRMFNADGSEGLMCGNAIRCVGKYFYETYLKNNQDTISVETPSGIKHLTLQINNDVVESVTVNMGTPSLQPTDIPVLNNEPFINQPILNHYGTAVSMGNPHLVLPINDIDNFPLLSEGPKYENHPLFPNRVNTEIVEQISPTHLRMRVWERGSGETLACGTGACAAVVAFTHLNRCPRNTPITVSLIGGDLTITYLDNNHVLMQGPATEVYRGIINI